MILRPGAHIPHVDALLVLGRGVDDDGTLSAENYSRSEIAARLAEIISPRVIVFSTDRSWRQVRANKHPRSEGYGMLDHALSVSNDPEALAAISQAEVESTHTVGNFVYSKPMLGLKPGETLGVLSDKLHFKFRRPQLIGRTVMPEINLVPLIIPDITKPSPASIAEELASTIVTRAFFTGVEAGDLDAIMERQATIEKFNGYRQDAIEYIANFRASHAA